MRCSDPLGDFHSPADCPWGNTRYLPFLLPHHGILPRQGGWDIAGKCQFRSTGELYSAAQGGAQDPGPPRRGTDTAGRPAGLGLRQSPHGTSAGQSARRNGRACCKAGFDGHCAGLLRLFADTDSAVFVEQVMDAVCIHDFGTNMLWDTAVREGILYFSHLAEIMDFLLGKMCGRT